MAKYTHTRMNKHLEINNVPTLSSGEAIFNFQLEGGDEECQIKRIFATAVSDSTESNLYTFTVALNDASFATSGDFTAGRVIFQGALGPGSPFVWNETQTIRVLRNDVLGIMVDGSANNVNPEELQTSVQVNYLVLS